MSAKLTPEQIALILAQPENDGTFPPHEAELARRMGVRRPLILLAFAPKAAGTFFRSAVIKAADGQLVRAVHAQGGRDAQPYLPLFVHYYAGAVTEKTLVAHLHMQALSANRHFLEAFGIRPVIMLRNIADMMASFWDMLERGGDLQNMGLNFHVPLSFPDWPRHRKQEFFTDMLVPWYASYFASWHDYWIAARGKVLALRYDEFVANPIGAMQKTLHHVGLPDGEKRCRDGYDVAWGMRASLRFNQGKAGRGGTYFTLAQRQHIAAALDRYDGLAGWRDALI